MVEATSRTPLQTLSTSCPRSRTRASRLQRIDCSQDGVHRPAVGLRARLAGSKGDPRADRRVRRTPIGRRRVVRIGAKRLYSWGRIYASRLPVTRRGIRPMATNSTTTAAAPAKVETVTLLQIAETLSESHELPKK